MFIKISEMTTQLKFFACLQPLIVIVLFTVFFLYFGLPSYDTFMMKDVIIKETKEPATAIDTPAITVCIEMVSLYLSCKALPYLILVFIGYRGL